jgi:hypothetical protein
MGKTFKSLEDEQPVLNLSDIAWSDRNLLGMAVLASWLA